MLVTLGIVALAMSFAAAATRGPEGERRLRIVTLDVATSLRQARANAVLLQRPVPFTMLPKAHGYRVDAAGATVRLPSSMGLTLVSNGKGPASADTSSITFYPDGSSSGGHLILTEGRASVRVGVAWLTGAVTLEGQSP
jgi:general secretion pathway protein H